MALEDLKDQFKERMTDAWGKIQESPLFNALRERYETLPTGGQIGIIVGTLLIVVLLVLSIPLSYFNSAAEFNNQFNENRSLIRGLLRASRLASDLTATPQAPSAAELKNQIQNMLTTFTLLPDQVGPMLDLDPKTLNFTNVVSTKSLQQEGLGISLKKLNLKQTVDIGFELQKINPSVKVAGIEMNANQPDPHYFDVLYKLVVFNMPNADAENLPAENRREKNNAAPRKKSTDETTDSELESEE